MQRSFRSAIGLALLAAALATMPGSAFAHPFGSLQGFAAAAVHPLTGLDHLLAMVAVGLWATHRATGGRGPVEWRLPLAFAGGLSGGAILGAFGVPQLNSTVPTDLAVKVTPLGNRKLPMIGVSGR